MPISKIKDMVDGYDDRIMNIEDQMGMINKQIEELQQEQDALQEVLEKIYFETVNEFLLSQCNHLYFSDNFYSGIGIGTPYSNIENFQGYDLVPIENGVFGQNYYDVSYNPPLEKPYDGIFVPYVLKIINTSSIINKFNEFSHTIDYIHHPLGFTGTYGTKVNIENLTNAKGLLESNKQKFINSKTLLSRFGEE